MLRFLLKAGSPREISILLIKGNFAFKSGYKLFIVPLHYKRCSKRKEWGEPTLQGYIYTVIISRALRADALTNLSHAISPYVDILHF